MKKEDRTIVIALLFKNMIERQFNAKIKEIQTYGRSEFKPIMVQLQKEGILHRVTRPHTSQQNSVVECRRRRNVERDLTLLLTCQLFFVPMLFKLTLSYSIYCLLESFLDCLLLKFYMKKILNMMIYKYFWLSILFMCEGLQPR